MTTRPYTFWLAAALAGMVATGVPLAALMLNWWLGWAVVGWWTLVWPLMFFLVFLGVSWRLMVADNALAERQRQLDQDALERQARADAQTRDDVHVTAVDCADVLALIAEVRRLRAELDEYIQAMDVVLDRERETADLAVKYEAERDALRDAIASNTANGEALDTARALLLEHWDASNLDAALDKFGQLKPFATDWTRKAYAFLWPEGKKP